MSSPSAPSEKLKEKKEAKPIPINKYSIHEMKSSIDTKIVEFLEESKFAENHYLSNVKIAVGLFCLSFTALAYLYPKPFPENYNVVLFSVIMYVVGSLMYYYVEKYMIKQSFYTGFSEEYVSKLRYGKKEKLKYFRLSSEIKDYSKIYELWIDFITLEGTKISPERVQIDCTKLCDERGYVLKDKVVEEFTKILTEQLTKKIN